MYVLYKVVTKYDTKYDGRTLWASSVYAKLKLMTIQSLQIVLKEKWRSYSYFQHALFIIEATVLQVLMENYSRDPVSLF